MTFDPLSFARKSISYHTDLGWPTNLNKINYVLRGNGLWEVRKNKIGTFYIHAYSGKIAGFPDPQDEAREGFALDVPKIPRSLLNQVISFFKKLCEDHDFEAYAQFYWDPDQERYWIRVPKQEVSKGRVKYASQEGVDPRNILVCEIHSHNSMSAFFSGVDDADEKSRGDRFFGVVGRLDTHAPEIKLSFIVGGGERKYIKVSDLFDEEEFPSEWLDQVEYLDKEPNAELLGSAEPPVSRYFNSADDQDEEEIEEQRILFSEGMIEENEDEDDEVEDIVDHFNNYSSKRGFVKYGNGSIDDRDRSFFRRRF